MDSTDVKLFQRQLDRFEQSVRSAERAKMNGKDLAIYKKRILSAKGRLIQLHTKSGQSLISPVEIIK